MEFPDKIIRGDGKVQHEYIRVDIVNEDYNAALREGHNDGYKDATKNIKAVYEKYKDWVTTIPIDAELYKGCNRELWQAIKADLGEE